MRQYGGSAHFHRRRPTAPGRLTTPLSCGARLCLPLSVSFENVPIERPRLKIAFPPSIFNQQSEYVAKAKLSPTIHTLNEARRMFFSHPRRAKSGPRPNHPRQGITRETPKSRILIRRIALLRQIYHTCSKNTETYQNLISSQTVLG